MHLSIKYYLIWNFHWHYNQIIYQINDDHAFFLIIHSLQSLYESKIQDLHFDFSATLISWYRIMISSLFTIEHPIVVIENKMKDS